MAAAHQEFRAIFLVGRSRGRNIILVALGIMRGEARDPVSLSMIFLLI